MNPKAQIAASNESSGTPGFSAAVRTDLKRFAKNLNHNFWRSAAQGLIDARAPPFPDVSV
jgi:hypothetical protein